MTIGLFKVTETTRQILAKILIDLLDKYGLRKNIIAYVKDEEFNFNAMIVILKSIMNYESFVLDYYVSRGIVVLFYNCALL